MSWNRQYRPATLDQLQIASVRQQLETIIKSGKLPQVFLFAGPKGTGKTSSARILALLVNDPVNAELFAGRGTGSYRTPDIKTDEAQKILQGQSFLVQELDAASNRGIDDVRSLKERLNMPPLPGHTTVVILDEVHMLTTEAYNALLKILEEPPNYCLFILATTELHKIPETIISRCQFIQFRQATDQELLASVQQILEKEKIPYDASALTSLIQQARGSFRDAIKLAEMVALQGEVNIENANRFAQVNLDDQIKQLLQAVTSKDAAAIIKVFEKLRSVQADQENFVASLFQTLHQAVLDHYQDQPPQIPIAVAQYLLKQLIPLPVSHPFIPFLQLEMQLLEIITKAKQQTGSSSRSNPPPPANTSTNQASVSTTRSTSTVRTSDLRADAPALSNTKPKSDGSNLTEQIKQVSNSPILQASVSLPNERTSASVALNPEGSIQKICDNWLAVVQGVATHNPTISALLQSAIPSIDQQGCLVIQVFYPFHQEQLKQHKFSQIIQKVVAELAGGEVKLTFAVIKKQENTTAENDLLAAASQLLT